jgi:hypothetical protein
MENKEKVYLKGSLSYSDELSSKFQLSFIDYKEYFILRNNHDAFLRQPLCISQFVACKFVGGKWVVLEEPKRDFEEYDVTERGSSKDAFYEDYFEFQEAKQRVLFSNCEYLGTKEGNHVVMFKNENSIVKNYIRIPIFQKSTQTIEDLTKYNLELSKTAVKTLGL